MFRPFESWYSYLKIVRTKRGTALLKLISFTDMRIAIQFMTTYKPGTIVLLDFPHTDGAMGKPRPALVVLDTGDADFMVARITSQNPQSAYEFPISDWQGCWTENAFHCSASQTGNLC